MRSSRRALVEVFQRCSFSKGSFKGSMGRQGVRYGLLSGIFKGAREAVRNFVGPVRGRPGFF